MFFLVPYFDWGDWYLKWVRSRIYHHDDEAGFCGEWRFEKNAGEKEDAVDIGKHMKQNKNRSPKRNGKLSEWKSSAAWRTGDPDKQITQVEREKRMPFLCSSWWIHGGINSQSGQSPTQCCLGLPAFSHKLPQLLMRPERWGRKEPISQITIGEIEEGALFKFTKPLRGKSHTGFLILIPSHHMAAWAQQTLW